MTTETRITILLHLNGVPVPASLDLEELRAAFPELALPELMTTEEAALYLRTTPRGIHDRVHRSGLPVEKDGSRSLFRRSAIDAWLDASTRRKALERVA